MISDWSMVKLLWPISWFFFIKFKFYQLLIDFETKLVYIINCFPASTPTKTSVTFICSPPPSPIGFNNWDYHWYCVEEMWLVGGNPRGAPGHPSLHNRKQQWFQLNVFFFIDCFKTLIRAYCTIANFITWGNANTSF